MAGGKKRCKGCNQFAYLSIDQHCEICAVKHQDEDECGTCNKAVKNEDNGLNCNACEKWFHAGCEKVEQDLYKVLQKYKSQLWFCRQCKSKVVNFVAKIQKLENQNNELSNKLKNLENRVENIKENRVGNTNTNISESTISEITIKVVEKMEEREKEKEEQQKRKYNIIIFNLPEPTETTLEGKIQEDTTFVSTYSKL